MIEPPVAPVLVLGLGNLLLTDDGVGLRLLEMLEKEFTSGVEFIDGGTQGIALTGYFAERTAVLVLDAVSLGAAPGTVHFLQNEAISKLRARRATNAHEGNGLALIDTARVLGYLPERLAVIGIEPAEVKTGIGLSPEVESALQAALTEARHVLAEFTVRETTNLCV